MTPFQRLLIIRCIRGDKVSLAIQEFIKVSMGEQYLSPPPFDLAGVCVSGRGGIFGAVKACRCCAVLLPIVVLCLPLWWLAGSHADSSVSQPLVFVLSPGSDPMAALLYFAETVKKKVDSISLGQGQVWWRHRVGALA